MSLKALSWAKEFRTGSPTRKLVLLAVADYADEHGVCWPSQRTIARQTELNERTVRRQLDELEHAGIVTRQSRPPLPSGLRQSDVITLNMKPPVTVSAGSDHRTLCPKPPVTVSAKPPVEPVLSKKGTNLSGYSTAQDRPAFDDRVDGL